MNFSISARNKWGTRSFWNGSSFGCLHCRQVCKTYDELEESQRNVERFFVRKNGYYSTGLEKDYTYLKIEEEVS